MSVQYSTALRNFLQGFGSKKQAFTGGVFEIFEGAPPTSPDDAATGTKLLRVTIGSGAYTPEVLSSGTVTLSGAGGQVDGITVNSVQLLAAAVPYVTDLATTAAAVATAINSNITSPRYRATSSSAVVTIYAMNGTGTGPNTYTVACNVSGGSLAQATGNMAGGVASANGLKIGEVVAGAIQKSGVWSGVVLATGTAGYWRLTGSTSDNLAQDVAPFTRIRMQGTCGTSGADYNMSTTSLVIGATHTVDTWVETLEE